METFRDFFRRVRRRVRRIGTTIRRASSNVLPTHHSNDSEKSDDLEANMISHAGAATHGQEPSFYSRMRPTSTETPPNSPSSEMAPRSPASPTASEAVTIGSPGRGKQLWKHALRTVKMSSMVSSPFAMTGKPAPHRQRTTSSTLTSSVGERKRTMAEEPLQLRSRVSAFIPKLKCLETTQDLAAHQALVRHLQFSPDGKFLATSRCA